MRASDVAAARGGGSGNDHVSTEFDETSYVVKSMAVYVVVLLDVVANAFFEPPSPTLLGVLVTMIVQLVLLCGCVVALYFLFTKTAYFQAGLFGPLITRFRALWVATPLNMLLLLATRGVRLGMLLNNTPPLLIWTPLFTVLYIAHRAAYLWFYVELLRTTRNLRDPKLYTLSMQDVRKALAAQM